MTMLPIFLLFSFFLIREVIFAHYRKFRNHRRLEAEKNIYSTYPSCQPDIQPSNYLTTYYVPSVVLGTEEIEKQICKGFFFFHVQSIFQARVGDIRKVNNSINSIMNEIISASAKCQENEEDRYGS